jgi:hypothetical protein
MSYTVFLFGKLRKEVKIHTVVKKKMSKER